MAHGGIRRSYNRSNRQRTSAGWIHARVTLEHRVVSAVGRDRLGTGLTGVTPMEHAIIFDNVTLGYDRHPAVHHLSGRIAAGSLTAIIGPNGAGKSTLLKGIAGLNKPLEGTIELHDGLAERLAYLPQTSSVDASFPIDVTDFVSLGLWREVGLLGRITGQRSSRVLEAIARVGLQGYERRTLDTLSGGQLQRVLFARLIVQDAQLLLLDEPFSAIDDGTAADLTALLHDWHADGRTTVAVLHDLNQVRSHFPETLLLARELVAWGPTPDVMTPDNLGSAGARVHAFDDDAAWCRIEAEDTPPVRAA